MPLLNRERFLRFLQRRLTEDLPNNMAEAVAEKARDVCPRDTGRLADGYYVVRAKKPGDKAYVANDVEYHDYVDQGTAKMAPRAMIRQAIDSVDDDLRRYLTRRPR